MGNALSFDGTDDYVDCKNNVGNFYLLDPFTIEAWINSTLDNSDDVIYGNAWAVPGYHVRVTSENKVRFMLIDTGSIYQGIDSPALTAGRHHIVSVWYGIDEKIYVDDVDDSQTAIENGTVIIITTTANTKVGWDTTFVAHYFNGLIDESASGIKPYSQRTSLSRTFQWRKVDLRVLMLMISLLTPTP